MSMQNFPRNPKIILRKSCDEPKDANLFVEEKYHIFCIVCHNDYLMTPNLVNPLYSRVCLSQLFLGEIGLLRINKEPKGNLLKLDRFQTLSTRECAGPFRKLLCGINTIDRCSKNVLNRFLKF